MTLRLNKNKGSPRKDKGGREPSNLRTSHRHGQPAEFKHKEVKD